MGGMGGSVSVSFAGFLAEMRKIFDRPVSTPLVWLIYSIEFRTIAAESGWNEVSLQWVV